MLPNRMIVERVERELEGIEDRATAARGSEAEAALAEAGASVRSLGLGSDDQAILNAWRAVHRAEVAITQAARVSQAVRHARTAPPPR